MVYGGPLPTLTATYSGFVNGDTPASLASLSTLATTATASSPLSGNPYSITVSGAVDQHVPTSYVAETLDVAEQRDLERRLQWHLDRPAIRPVPACLTPTSTPTRLSIRPMSSKRLPTRQPTRWRSSSQWPSAQEPDFSYDRHRRNGRGHAQGGSRRHVLNRWDPDARYGWRQPRGRADRCCLSTQRRHGQR